MKLHLHTFKDKIVIENETKYSVLSVETAQKMIDLLNEAIITATNFKEE